MKKQTKIQIGARLFIASVILYIGTVFGSPMSAFIFAGVIMSLPSFTYSRFHKRILGEGFTEGQQTELKDLLKGVADKNKELVKEELQRATEGLMKKDDLAASLEKIGLKENVIKELTDAVEKQGLELQKILAGNSNKHKSVDEIINEKAAEIAKLSKDEVRTVKIELPRANKTLVQRSALSDGTLGMRIPGIGELETLQPVLAGIFRNASIGTNSNGIVRYMDQATVTRGADMKAEAAAFAESAITWIERTAAVQKITDSIPVSKEAFNDIEFIKSEIERLLNINLALKEDQQLYAGTGVAPQIKGINVYAVTAQATIAAAPYADTIESANLYDLVAVIRTVIMLRGQNKYNPNYVLLNPADILRYKLLKGSDGHYVLPPFISADGQTIDNIRVIESQQVTANTLQMGDSRFGTIYRLGGTEVEMGWINDQFVKDTMTLKASQRELLLVRDVDANAFAKITDITAALALLETP